MSHKILPEASAPHPHPILTNGVELVTWKSSAYEYLKDLLLTTVSTVTPLAVGFAVLSYIHRHYNSDEETAIISHVKKAKVKEVLQKWGLDHESLNLNEYEWAIGMSLGEPEPPDKLLSWDDIAGCQKEIEKLINLLILPVQQSQSNMECHKNKTNKGCSRERLIQVPKGILIHGPPGTGKTLLAKIIADQAHCKILTLDPSKLSDRHVGDSEKLTSALFTLAEKLEPCIIFIDEIDSLLKTRSSSDHNLVSAASKGIFLSYWDGLGDEKSIILIGTTNRPKDIDPGFLRRFDINLKLDLPDLKQRKSILKAVLKTHKNSFEEGFNFNEIAYDLAGFSGGDIKEICRQSFISASDIEARDGKGLTLTVKHFQDAIIESKRTRSSCGGFGGLDEYEMKIAGSLLAPQSLEITWEDVAGLDDVVDRLQKNVIMPLMAYRRPELKQSSLIQPPKGILLYGEPGCGKTLLAKALAKYVNCSFINLQPSDLQGSLYGETSRNVKALFSLAEKCQPCIIFIDEIDSLFRKRQCNDHETTLLLKTSFMSLWDGILSSSEKNPKNIIILGATNQPDSIDPAILRRLPEKIHVPLPDRNQRVKILKTILKREIYGEDVNLEKIADYTAGLSGSDLKEISRNAAINAVHGMESQTELLTEKISLSKTGAGDLQRDPKECSFLEQNDTENILGSGKVIRMIHFEQAVSDYIESKLLS